jgi:hypothetical protein
VAVIDRDLLSFGVREVRGKVVRKHMRVPRAAEHLALSLSQGAFEDPPRKRPLRGRAHWSPR